jgi:hypothetical protein
MSRFVTALPKTLIAAPPLFQTALPFTVANPGPGRAIRKFSMIVKAIWRRRQAAAIATRPANVLMVGLTLGALLAMQNFVQTAKAQQSNTARQQVIRECNLMEKRTANEPQEGTKTGGRQFVYKGCMADHGQGE